MVYRNLRQPPIRRSARRDGVIYRLVTLREGVDAGALVGVSEAQLTIEKALAGRTDAAAEVFEIFIVRDVVENSPEATAPSE